MLNNRDRVLVFIDDGWASIDPVRLSPPYRIDPDERVVYTDIDSKLRLSQNPHTVALDLYQEPVEWED